MALYHTVVQGECLASISRKYGFLNYRTIYDAPENDEFRRRRPNPNIINPGDQLYIPDKKVKMETRGTDAHYTFQISPQKVVLRVVVKRDGGTPYANKTFELTVGNSTVRDQTSGDGLLEVQIPADVTTGTLKIFVGEKEADGAIVWNLSIGHLDPPDTVTGLQARLNNLGFYCGQVDGIVGPKTERALRAFQIVNGLPVTAALDAATCGLLEGEHDVHS
jgi:N-acetylmuramoyl-L-alanine amidase